MKNLTLTEERVYIALYKYLIDSNIEILKEEDFPTIEYLYDFTKISKKFAFGRIFLNLVEKGFLRDDFKFMNSRILYSPQKDIDDIWTKLTPNEFQIYYFLRYVFDSNGITYDAGFPMQKSSIAKGVRLDEDESEKVLENLISKGIISNNGETWYIIKTPFLQEKSFPKKQSESKQLEEKHLETLNEIEALKEGMRIIFKQNKLLHQEIEFLCLKIDKLREKISSYEDPYTKCTVPSEAYSELPL